MKDSFFKDPIVSFTSVPCEYTGSTDLYPRKNRNLINNENFREAAIKIQRWWRGKSFCNVATQLENEHRKERFWSWFPF